MWIRALDTFDNRTEGEEFECSEHQAKQLIAKGLAKAGRVPQNKMAPPADDKRAPMPAAGEAQKSSASRAARVSRKTTAKPSDAGAVHPLNDGE